MGEKRTTSLISSGQWAGIKTLSPYSNKESWYHKGRDGDHIVILMWIKEKKDG